MSASQMRTDLTKTKFEFKDLIGFLEVVYGVVMGYGFYEIAQALKPLMLGNADGTEGSSRTI